MPAGSALRGGRAGMGAFGEGVLSLRIVRRKGREPMVWLSLREWRSIRETEYLLSNPVMAERLRRGVADMDAGLAPVEDGK